jgi:hypothetical protein
MRKAASFAVLVAAFAFATRVGWWTIPLVAALWGVLRPRLPRPALSAAAAAGLAWVAWLAFDALRGPGALGVLATRLGGVMRLPIPVLFLVTILFPALLAWSASVLAGGLAGSFVSRSGDAR